MRIYIYILLIGLFPLFNSCNKRLEEKPYSFVSAENFYKTATDAELALTGTYDILNAISVQGQGNHNMWGRGMEFLTSMGCDELINDATRVSNNIEVVTISNYTFDAENILFTYSYFFMYAGINRANLIIEKVPSIPMDPVRREQIVGEARFLRGMYYFYLGWLYGGVPLIESSQADSKVPRAPLENVMKLAETDFRFAYEKLPARNVKEARVNKFTAGAFLVKLYLYLAACKTNNVGEALNFPLNSFKWVDEPDCVTKCRQVADVIYAQSGYKLIRPYRNLFLSGSEAQAREEHMMIVQSGAGGSSEAFLFPYLAGPLGDVVKFSGFAGWMRPVREAWTRFNPADPRRDSIFSGYLFAPTVTFTVGGHTYYRPDKVTSDLKNLCINKWREDLPANRASRGIPAYNGELDYGIIRYADFLLMYAEVKALGGDIPGARELLREVRLRACNDNTTQLATITTAYYKEDFMQELLDERSRELLGEGWRRFDLIRMGKLKSVVANLDPSQLFTTQNVAIVKANFADNKIWYPIPRRELETNTSLIPNPGY